MNYLNGVVYLSNYKDPKMKYIIRGEITRKKILNEIIDYTAIHGYPPTVREIAKELKIKSLATVQGHLKRMLQEGTIESDHKFGASRAIRVPGYKLRRVEK